MEHLYQSEARGVSLFIGGLSKETSLQEIISYVEQFSPVTYFHMPVHKVSGQPVGYAFVRVASPRAADMLVNQANNIGGRIVDVQIAVDKQEKESYKQDLLKRKVFIAGIKHFVDFSHIELALQAQGELKIFYKIETSHKNRGLAFAEFFDTNAAEKVVAKGLYVDGCQLRVSFFRPKPGTEQSHLLMGEQYSQFHDTRTIHRDSGLTERSYFFENEYSSQDNLISAYKAHGMRRHFDATEEPSENYQNNYTYRVATQGVSLESIQKITMHGAALILKSGFQKPTLKKHTSTLRPSKGTSRNPQDQMANLDNLAADHSSCQHNSQVKSKKEIISEELRQMKPQKLN